MIAQHLVETRARNRKLIWQSPRLIMVDKDNPVDINLLLDVDILTAKSSYIELSKKQNVLTQKNAGYGINIETVQNEDGTEDSIISFCLDERIAIVVAELPEQPSEELKNKIFLVPSEESGEKNVFSEYVWITKDGSSYWEQVGTWLPRYDAEEVSAIWDYINLNLSVDTELNENSNHPISNGVATKNIKLINSTLTWVDA